MEANIIDYAVASAFQAFQPEWLTTLMRLISALGDMTGYFVVVPLVVAYFLWHGRRQVAAATVLVMAGNILNPFIKWLVGRPRPSEELVRVLGSAPGSSFPSGHALAATIFYGFLVYVAATHPTQHRRLIIAVLTVLILLIGFSRVYLGVHWPSDVIAGYSIGVLWLVLFTRVVHSSHTIDRH